MRSELSLARASGTLRVPGAGVRGRWPADATAVVLLIALPVLAFGLPALLGHAVWPGDDLTQNFPLRVLAGRQLRDGHLPLFNPYIWSGAPLLGGWNAGAVYPLTLLFAVLPGTAAWTLNMIVTWAAAGLGMFFFLRALRLASLPSLLGALSFAFAGAMSAQVAHFGLVAGMSWVPVQLLSVLRLTQPRGTASRLAWIGVLAAAAGVTILAGEPRAVVDADVIVVCYAAWRIAHLGRRWAPAALAVAAGLALGLCLGAVQWLPGLAVIGASQRAASSAYLFNSGSLPSGWLLLMLVPDLLGGSGSLGQPAFFAHYNLAEVTGYIGILPLVAAAALLGRLRLRQRPPEWLIWHVVALLGVVLALGGNTPLGPLLAHLPLYGSQRLQSRNILVTDVALAILLAYWADHVLTGRLRRPAAPDITATPDTPVVPAGRRRLDREMILGILPPLGMIAVAIAGLGWGAGLAGWLQAGPGTAGAAGRLGPSMIPYLAIGAAAIAFVILWPRLRLQARSRWLRGLVLADIVVFTVFGVVAVLPGLGGGADRPAGATVTAQTAAGAESQASAPRSIASLGYRGRFAIYDPDLLAADELSVLGSPDLNAISSTPSVQGYTSLVDGRYARATGSHLATGGGQNVLAPSAARDGTLDQLDTSVLLTPSAYLITAAGAAGHQAAPGAGPPGTGRRDIAAGQEATWYLAGSIAVSRVEIPDTQAMRDAAAGTRIGLVTPGGATRWFRPEAGSAPALVIGLPHPVTTVAVVAGAGTRPGRLGPPAVTGPDGLVLAANGQLQDALTPPRWGYAGRDGSFAIFVDRFARGPLRLEPLPGQTISGASARRLAGPGAAPTAAAVSSANGVRVVRAVAAISGWSASWQPRHGPARAVPIGREGLVQAVDVPPGRGVVTWTYAPRGVTAGLALSLAAVVLIIALMTGRRSAAAAARLTRSLRRSGPGRSPGPAGPGPRGQ
jgi:hypothetical protein